MRERRIGVAMLVLALLVLAARHPLASLRIDTRVGDDHASHSVQAAIDLGLVGVSLLWTWNGAQLVDSR